MRMLAIALGSDTRDADDAEALLLRVTERAPDYAEAWINLARCTSRRRNGSRVPRAFRKATRLEPDAMARPGRDSPMRWPRRGYPEQSVEAYRKTVELSPFNAYAHMGLAHVLKAVGQQEQAIAAYRAAIALRPDFGEAYWSLANLKTFRFTPESK